MAAGAGAAGAADMYVPGPAEFGGYKDASAVSDWSGFYIGIHGGGGWGNTAYPQGIDSPSFPYAPSPDQSSSGWLFGGQAGYTWQYGRFVGGLEVDYSAADIKGTVNLPVGSSVFTRETKIDELASVRGRLGFTVTPRLLAYGTAGLALAHHEYASPSRSLDSPSPEPRAAPSSAGSPAPGLNISFSIAGCCGRSICTTISERSKICPSPRLPVSTALIPEPQSIPFAPA
jgi:opacity protein-like surface antigen